MIVSKIEFENPLPFIWSDDRTKVVLSHKQFNRLYHYFKGMQEESPKNYDIINRFFDIDKLNNENAELSKMNEFNYNLNVSVFMSFTITLKYNILDELSKKHKITKLDNYSFLIHSENSIEKELFLPFNLLRQCLMNINKVQSNLNPSIEFELPFKFTQL